jgi:hypothetical protein
MGMCKAPVISSRTSIDTTLAPHARDVVEAPALQMHEPMQSAFESTPEKFVAFVNRMTEAEAHSTSRLGKTARKLGN